MATAEHKAQCAQTQPVSISRRAILAGAAVAPVALALPAVALIPGRSVWEAALKAYRASEGPAVAAGNAFDEADLAIWKAKEAMLPKSGGATLLCRQGETGDECVARYNREQQAQRARRARKLDKLKADLRLDELKARYDAALDANDAACRALLMTPAPDMAALAEKMEIAEQESLASEYHREFLADAQRLAGKAVRYA